MKVCHFLRFVTLTVCGGLRTLLKLSSKATCDSDTFVYKPRELSCNHNSFLRIFWQYFPWTIKICTVALSLEACGSFAREIFTEKCHERKNILYLLLPLSCDNEFNSTSKTCRCSMDFIYSFKGKRLLFIITDLKMEHQKDTNDF